MANSLLRNLFAFEDEETAGEVLAGKLLEVFVLLIVTQYAWVWAKQIQLNSAVVRSLGFANWVDITLLFGPQAYVVAALITVFAVVGVLRMWRGAHLVGLLLLCFQFAARYSLGEIPHSSNLFGCAYLGMALAPLLYESPRHQRRFAFGLLLFLVGVCYTSAAVCKLVATGFHWPDGRHLWVWIQARQIHNMTRDGVTVLAPMQHLALSSWWLATGLLVVGLVSESLAWLVWFRRTRRAMLVAILGLHLGIYASMQIIFREATLLLVVLIVPWETVFNALLQRWPTKRAMEALVAFSQRFA